VQQRSRALAIVERDFLSTALRLGPAISLFWIADAPGGASIDGADEDRNSDDLPECALGFAISFAVPLDTSRIDPNVLRTLSQF
jgi:hypothetical protein